MQTVIAHNVTANVRTDGAIGVFEERTFQLMLGRGTPDQQRKEAIRILRQIGYETRGITNIEERS